MLVCLCKGVPESKVREAIGEGACNRRSVTRACGAGGVCGGCHDQIKDMIREGRTAAAPKAAPAAASEGPLAPEAAFA